MAFMVAEMALMGASDGTRGGSGCHPWWQWMSLMVEVDGAYDGSVWYILWWWMSFLVAVDGTMQRVAFMVVVNDYHCCRLEDYTHDGSGWHSWLKNYDAG